ncbi:MAG: endolytic transglycosylase MltG [Hellea sp.]|nr:endolytic transglycosylase MltG [Hellea sp.]
MENGQSSPKLKKRHKGLIAFVGLGAVLTILVGVLFASWSFLQYTFVSQGPLAEETVFTVPQGAGTSSIANKLAAEGIIDSATMFKLMIRLDKVDGTLKAGEFMIPPEASLRDVMEVLKDGKAILYPFTAPEGLTSAQIMRAMAKVPTLIDDSPGMPAEGTLLPETYMTPRGMSRSQLVAKMQTAQSDLLDKLWDKRQDGLPIKTREEAIILASIVEKETGVTSERDKVAGVFINRLNKGMRLQSDPTIIYGVSQGEPLGRGIRQSEIDRVTDWNTYQMDGLPKTPICNPGREAIAAVLNPAATEYIYFVADGTGGHIFGKTLAEHNENVKNWRKIERERKRAAGGGE